MQRNTRQRRAICAAFETATRPMSVEEVHATAGRRQPTLSLATLYRALADLVQAGELTRVMLPGQPPRYQRTHDAHRHLFQCDRCRKVYEVEGCPGAVLHRAPKGFAVRAHQVILYGDCADCLSVRPARAKARAKPAHARAAVTSTPATRRAPTPAAQTAAKAASSRTRPAPAATPARRVRTTRERPS
jgi:Fur family transcriptional regulator, ferric uptake regulator